MINRVDLRAAWQSKRATGFLLFNILYGWVFAAHFAHFSRFALEQDFSPHFSLILLVSVYLMYLDREELSMRAEYGAPAGILLILAGGLCSVWSLKWQAALSPQDTLTLTTFGVVIVWIGGFVTFFGLAAARIALFPLGFLAFVPPLPEAVLSRVITALQYASADVVAFLFRFTPVQVVRDGLFFTLPGFTIEVAKECSSIRSSMALLIACVLANHLLLRRWWSKAIVLLLVFPLAVFKNGVRIVTLCLLTLYADKGFMEGSLHTRGGAAFFALALVMLVPVYWGFRTLESRRAD